ncbi:hypothetical protein M9Y10_033774 [Tritrichomonas musculus]|uniref:Integrase catalytic domain-containing protein n=1 Tax=Tritrichomonas musculus TaxID=1915356 RepID=A0ABR2KD26_9EUKA
MYNPLSPETIEQIKSDLSAGASWKFIENKYLTTKYMVKQYLGNDYKPKCIGRPKMVLDDTVKNFIVSKKVECGVGCSILTQIIRHDHSNDTVMENLPPGSKISYRQVYKTIKDVSLLHHQVDPNRHPSCITRYEAEYCNAIWHGDVHFFHNDQKRPIFALIDDKSRFIIYCDKISNKSSETIRECFIQAINQYGLPYTYWSDNCGENVGKILIELFKLYNINSTFTDSYTPQQNGKAEAFWKYIEAHCHSEDDIPDAIKFYNNVKPHTSQPSSIINGIHVPHTPGIEYQNSIKHNGIESRAFYNVTIPNEGTVRKKIPISSKFI